MHVTLNRFSMRLGNIKNVCLTFSVHISEPEIQELVGSIYKDYPAILDALGL